MNTLTENELFQINQYQDAAIELIGKMMPMVPADSPVRAEMDILVQIAYAVKNIVNKKNFQVVRN